MSKKGKTENVAFQEHFIAVAVLNEWSIATGKQST
jgi:hypothetical protein